MFTTCIKLVSNALKYAKAECLDAIDRLKKPIEDKSEPLIFEWARVELLGHRRIEGEVCQIGDGRFERWLRGHTRNTAHKATTLVRYYLFECKLFSVCLHRFIRDDEPGEFHNHPFNWISIFLGSYVEEVLGKPPRRIWFMNYGGASYHRVTGMSGRWSLVIKTRDIREWGYIRRGSRGAE